MNASAMLRALIVPIVRDVLREELAAIGALAAPVTEYTSRSLPPCVPSRDRFHVLVKRAPGATKQGRVWRISVADWDAFRATSRPSKAPPAPAADPDVDALADAAIRAAGFRPTRTAA